SISFISPIVMVKSLVSKLSSASSTLSIASSFGSSHGKHHHHDNNTASSTASSSSTSNAISGDNYLKYRNDPGRFFGDGVQFKAKLIGILEVGEARGDRMCQEALQDLKMAIRAAGEHKQRITIHVTIDGLRLRDEKTGDSLYHHPVHKISFIAQDMTDSRAFGYIFGSPDSGHRFFGIKTDKAASQVVLAMRDLFQVVFELKKKEIELARQQIQSKSLHHHDTQHQLSSLSSLKSAAAGTGGQNDLSALGGSTTSAATLSMLNTMVSSSTNTPNTSRLGVNLDSKGASKEISPESVADLVDLEQELSSLQRGITQMERITPNDAHTTQTSSLTSNAAKTSTAMGGSSGGGAGGSDDPFGDSFTSFPTLPPPEPGRLRSKTTTKPNDINITNIPTTTAGNSSLLSPTATQSRLTPVSAGLTTTTVNLQPLDDDDDHWLRELDAHSDVFDTSKTVVPGLMGMPPLASSLSSAVPLASRAPLAARESSDTPPNHIYETVSCSANNVPNDMAELSSISNNVTNNNAAEINNTNNLANSSSLSDIFQTAAAESAQNSKLDIKSDLDPLGTGRTRPYVDKKYFFQELKNPPKKVLKDLTTNNQTATTATATAASLMMATTAAPTMTTVNNLMPENLTNKCNTTTVMATEDILNLGDFDLQTIQYQQQQLYQQQQQQQQSYKMTSAANNSSSITATTLNTLLTNTTAAIIPTATILTTTANNIINLATTGTNSTNTTTITSNPSTASNSKQIATCSTNFTTATANNYNNRIAITSSVTSTANKTSYNSHASLAVTANSTSTTTATATATNINTTNTICVTNSLNVNVSNIKNNIIASSSSCASANTSTSNISAFTRTATSLICTCPTSIIVTSCTTTNASTYTKKYTTTTTTNNNTNNNNNNNKINSNIPNLSNNSNTINNSNKNRNTTSSSSLLLTTHHQSKPSLSSASSKTMPIPMYMPPSMAMNMGSSGEGGGSGGASGCVGASGQDHHQRVLEAFQNPAIAPLQTNACSSSSIITTNKSSLSSLTFTTTTTTNTTITTTTTTTTTSSTTTTQNSTAMNQTNQTLRFSRYHPPLEPVAVTTAAASDADPVMLPRDTDPFSPTRKKSDPFEEGGDLFSKLDPFEFEFSSNIAEVDNLRKAPTSLTTSVTDQLAAVSSVAPPATQDLLAGHLQVNLPPEGDTTQTTSTVRSRPVPSAMTTASSGVGLGPGSGPTALPPASMLKQQTVDVISSISNKKMPHLFGQSSRFSKRDSNSINMRRLQESDSLSETETAPEPPPRPDYGICVEPPPLPPKKQFNDFVIRSRNGPSHSISSTAGNQSINSNRYDSLNSVLTSKTLTGRSSNTDVPPIPLPSRRVGRTDGSYPGPGRPRKPGHTEDDYLAPISLLGSSTGVSSSTANTSIMSDVPPLLPPPTQTSSRARTQRQQSLNQQNKAHEIYENKSEILQQLQQQQQQQQQQNILDHHNPAAAAIVPDITLTQLLTLGIDELAVKLNVPTSKLSTMTLVELTSYLSEFLEQNKPSKVEAHKAETSQEETHQHTPPIFKVNFDQEATFVAKFDDTFGEDFHQQTSSGAANTFEANFAQFDSVSVEPPVQAINPNSNMVPPADRYAVFREIIDQELQQQQESVDLIGDVMEDEIPQVTDEKQFETSNLTVDLDMNVTHQQDLLSGDMLEVTGPQPPKIDTKITEVLAQAKDRYAALRDLILVENLFDKPPPKPSSISGDMEVGGQSDSNKSPFQGFSGFNDDEEDQDLRQLMDQASTLDVTTQQQRLGLVDSRGFLVEPSSSAITVEEDEDDEEEEEERRNNTREEAGGLSSADSNEKEQDKDTLPTTKYEQLASSNQQLEEIEEKPEKYDDNPQISITQSQMPTSNEGKYLSVVSVASSGLSGSKDDLEIDDLMHRAISNLSLDSRERNSPAIQPQQQNTHSTTTTMTPPHFNDVSTSPIPLQRSPLPTLTGLQNKSPNNNKSPQQVSPLPSQLTVVSQIIDAATKQIQNDAVSKTSNDSWATFDTPQHQPVAASSDKRARPSAKLVNKANNFLNLPPPPGSISNCSQNDSAIESPCSSDPREEAWHKHTMGGSSLSLGHQGAPLGGSTSGQRRYHKKERQNTSSSSRDLSWDEDQGSIPPTHIMDYPSSKRLSGQLQGSLTTDRHGYYRRHARRMNSCDDEYDYEQDYASSRRDRDQCKYKHSLSRSRDNFDMDSPGWYHHHGGGPQHPHHTWSSQDIEQARGRNFERSAYERTTYGPPIYDKRGVGPPLPPTSSYDRRSAGGGVYDKRGKYYRGDTNPRSTERIYNLDDFDEMLAASGKIPAHLASMYEEMKAECCSPPGHRQRTADYMYERDRKSFDRESLESYEGSNVAPPRRRRRSYDSGGIPSDPYGSCDSRDEYHGRERCVMTADKSRSLRKSLKSLRVTGDIDYDQDSEKEYHYRDQRSRCDTRSLQRPSQLTTQGVSGVGVGVGGVGVVGGNVMGSQSRIRKSSGSSPWDGEEPPLPGQKTSSWKRPSSAAEAERRRAAVKGQTPSGSDEDKDRRYRKKRTTRNKDLPAIPSSAARYGRTGNYDYISCEDLDDDAEDYVDEEEEEEDHGIEHDEISPADEDKFARLEMRRHEMHNRMMDAHVRRRKEVPASQTQMSNMAYRKPGKGGYIRRPLPPPSEPKHPQDYGFDDDDGDDGEYEQTPTPRSNTSSALPTATPNASSTKFSFDVGFESDFNQSSPPPAPAGTASSCNSTPAANVSAANTPASKSSFRFSNDFSAGQEREKHFQHPPAGSLQQYDLENRGISPQTAHTQTSTPKLRFDDNVKVSQFDDAFEDDFSKATFDAFQNDDVQQWQESIQKTTKQQIRNNKLQQRQQELIKKSESVNIFAKKVEDPFEDDEFFNSPPTVAVSTSTSANEKTENHKTNGNNAGSTQGKNGGGGSGSVGGTSAGWDDDNTNFAKFDENM
ncbi:Protein disabled, partial [Lucilia cuprina]